MIVRLHAGRCGGRRNSMYQRRAVMQSHSMLTKEVHEEARAAGVPCVTTCGIYPGISNVMAAHMCALARKEYDLESPELSYRTPDAGARVEFLFCVFVLVIAGSSVHVC